MKSLVAQVVADRVQDGDFIGIGSGSTVEAAVLAIGKRVMTEKLSVRAITTSHRSAICALSAGIEVVSPFTAEIPRWCFDGADEVDTQLRLIKGGGGAMLSEKIVASRCSGTFLVLVTEDKLVKNLGEKFAVPLEIIPESLRLVERELYKLGAREILAREAKGKYGPLTSDHGNLILDVRFIGDCAGLEDTLNTIPGVVENGLFTKLSPEVYLAEKGEIFQLHAGHSRQKL
ncbi:MAG: ribose 5-phosphate isomerase A [bacterium]|nr:ribose 5-phosphate isomerase A [bacterium]